jgi:hypothetical protein
MPKSSPEPTRGRPPLPDSERADSQIQLRVTRKRKSAYVRAAKGETLAAWMFRVCDDASGANSGNDRTEQSPPDSDDGSRKEQSK